MTSRLLVSCLAFSFAASAQYQQISRWRPQWGEIPAPSDGVLTISARGMAFDQRWIIGIRAAEEPTLRYVGALVRGGPYLQSPLRIESLAPERFSVRQGSIVLPAELPLRPVLTLYVSVPKGQRVRIETAGGYFPPQRVEDSLVVDTGRVLRHELAGWQQLQLLGVRPAFGVSDVLPWTPPSPDNERKIWRLDLQEAAVALREYRELGRLPAPREPGWLTALQLVIEPDGAVSEVLDLPSELDSAVAGWVRLWRFAPRSSRSLLRVPVLVAADGRSLTTPLAPTASAPR